VSGLLSISLVINDSISGRLIFNGLRSL